MRHHRSSYSYPLCTQCTNWSWLPTSHQLSQLTCWSTDYYCLYLFQFPAQLPPSLCPPTVPPSQPHLPRPPYTVTIIPVVPLHHLPTASPLYLTYLSTPPPSPHPPHPSPPYLTYASLHSSSLPLPTPPHRTWHASPPLPLPTPPHRTWHASRSLPSWWRRMCRRGTGTAARRCVSVHVSPACCGLRSGSCIAGSGRGWGPGGSGRDLSGRYCMLYTRTRTHVHTHARTHARTHAARTAPERAAVGGGAEVATGVTCQGRTTCCTHPHARARTRPCNIQHRRQTKPTLGIAALSNVAFSWIENLFML